MAKLRVSRNDLGATFVVLGVLVGLYYVSTTMVFPGIPAGLGAALGTCLPGLMVTGMAMLGAMASRHGAAAVGAYSVTGFGLAIVLDELTTAGILTAAMLAPATLAQVQILVIILGFLVGIAAYRG